MSEESNAPLAGIKVLLVDDSNTIIKAGRNILQKEGAEVVTAMDGYQALYQLDTEHPDIVFLDITMPKLDGYQTASVIKGHADYRSIPVVMLSGNDGMFDRARARVAGSDDHLAKPINRDEIINAIREHVEAA